MQRDAQSSGHATEQALVLTPNAQTRQELAVAEAERADMSFTCLCNTLAVFLISVVQAAWPWPSKQARSSGQATQEAQQSSHATEQAQSSGHAAQEAPGQKDPRFSDDELVEFVYDRIAAWSERRGSSDQLFYSERHLLRHKRMWDVLVRDKAGQVRVEWTFVEWCRRVQS